MSNWLTTAKTSSMPRPVILPQEYARCQGEWSNAAELGDQPSTNLTLGELLGELASKSRLAGPVLDQLAGWPLKLAVVGKPYAGKSCAAQHMADKLQLKV